MVRVESLPFELKPVLAAPVREGELRPGEALECAGVRDQSRIDFAIACRLAEIGQGDSVIEAVLREVGRDAPSAPVTSSAPSPPRAAAWRCGRRRQTERTGPDARKGHTWAGAELRPCGKAGVGGVARERDPRDAGSTRTGGPCRDAARSCASARSARTPGTAALCRARNRVHVGNNPHRARHSARSSLRNAHKRVDYG